MDIAARAAGIAEINDPTTDAPPQEVSRDVELGTYHSRKSDNHSRVSLPLSHQRSFSISSKYRASSISGTHQTAYAAEQQDTTAGAEEGEHEQGHTDTLWDSSHPCWPHLNVHVPLNSPLYGSTRIIRIKRDWTVAGDLAPTFSLLYPEILEPLMPETRFRELIAHINEELVRIFNPYSARAWLDAGLGLVTGWLWDDLGLTGAKRELAKVEKWLEDWNQRYGQTPEFKVISLRRTAYLSLDIQVPDPQIGPDVDPTEADARSLAGSNAVKSSQTYSFKKAGGVARSPSNARSDYAASSVGRPTDDRAYGAYPIVPPIPGKYLEEAQQNVSLQAQSSPRSPDMASREG